MKLNEAFLKILSLALSMCLFVVICLVLFGQVRHLNVFFCVEILIILDGGKGK